jgi:hypothetical protein
MAAKIDIERRSTITATVPGITLTAKANDDAERIVGDVEVAITVPGAATASLILDIETLERLGKLAHDVRYKAGDMRDTCLVHGLYESARPHFDCPACRAERDAEAKQPTPAQA